MEEKHLLKTENTINDITEHEERMGFGGQLLRYTILFIITAVCTYALFIVLPRTFLSNAEGNIDGIAQQYPIYSEIKRLVHAFLSGQGWETWSWDIGLGGDTINEFNTKLLNPLTYIVIAFPQKYLDVGFTLMVLISQYLSGFAFMLLGRKMDFDYRQNITGGLCYAYCGWVIQAILRQGTFLIATILFPLLILGLEKILRNESPVLFMLATAAHGLYSMQWTYVGGISVVLWFIVRMIFGKRPSAVREPAAAHGTEHVERHGREEDIPVTDGIPECRLIRCTYGEAFARFFGYGMIGVMISGVVLTGSLYKMFGATISSTVEDPTFYPLAWYLEIPSGFFQTTPTTNAYTVLGMPALCVILLPLAVGGIVKKRPQAVMSVLLFIASFFPMTGRIFNGMSYSVGRWFYVMIFFMIWSAMDCYRPETFRKKSNIAVMWIWLAALGIWGAGVCWQLLGIINTAKGLSVCIGVLMGALLIMLLSIDSLSKGRGRGLLITGIIIVSIVGYVNTNLFPHLGEQIHTLCQVGRIESDFSDSTQRVGPAVQDSDEGFFRIDQVDGYTDARIARVRANENMYFGNRSIYTYLSTMDSGWHIFNRTVGNNAGYFDRTTSYSNDNREGLDFLLGVKYFLGDSETKKPGANDYAGYGFKKYDEIDGVQVLRNKYCMGLGTSYDKYITESELMEYTPLEREQVMLQTAVIPDKESSSLGGGIEAGIRHADKADISTDVRELKVKLSDFKNIDADLNKDGGGTLAVHKKGKKNGSFTVTLPETRKARIVLEFENFVRDDCDLDTELELSGKEFKGNSLSKKVKTKSFVDDEKFRIQVTRGDVVKAAQMRKGKNQGFGDVKDFYINLGYYDEISGEVTVDIDRVGIYHFDSVKAYAVPMGIYRTAAKELESRSMEISSFDHGEIRGTMTSDKNAVMYFSLLDGSGWDIYVDGNRLKGNNYLHDVNITFTGGKLPAGTHEVVLKHRTPLLVPGCVITLAGLALLVITAIGHRNRMKEEYDEETA